MKKIKVDKKLLYQLYVLEKRGLITTAKIMNLTYSTVRLRVIEYGWLKTKHEALMGHKIDKKTKKKISQSLIGHIPWNKGLTIKDLRVRKNIESANKSKNWKRIVELGQKYRFQKGQIPWNKNKPFMVLEKNPNWKGGKSFEPYHWIFNQRVKTVIKQRDGYICKNCGISQNESLFKFNKGLHIHHIDFNKNNNKFNNLITVCTVCNSKANFNRDYWTNYYRRML